jgi:polyisoprenoid-binding protein YceI
MGFSNYTARFTRIEAQLQFDPANLGAARVGFSAHGSLRRSEFGVSFGIPAPGTQLGVSDEVAVTLETEFNGPAFVAKAQ